MHLPTRSAFALWLLAAGCGGSSSDGTTTGTGTTQVDSSESTPAESTGASTAATSSSTNAATSDADTSTSGGGGVACMDNADCDAAAYCDFPDESCGVSGAAGTCTARPSGCDPEERPVCGCDDAVYASTCDAAAEGVDLAFLAECPVPNGAFECGFSYCILDQEYCAIAGGTMPSASCIVLPPVCQPPDCNCVSDCCACDSTACCSDLCTNEGGALTYTCPG